MVLARASDAELLSSARASRRSVAAFYDRYERAIAGYFMRRTRDAELTADLTAEVFAAAFAAADRYRPDAKTAAPWLFTIAQNTLASSVRRGRVEDVARTFSVTKRAVRNLVIFHLAGAWDPPRLTFRSRTGAVIAQTHNP